MLESIQDYAKKINSRLTFLDCVSLALTLLVLFGFLIIMREKEVKEYVPLVYSRGLIPKEDEIVSAPFASKKGKTYTFSWCSGSSGIKEVNKIYFKSEEAAKKSGRTLSKLCTK